MCKIGAIISPDNFFKTSLNYISTHVIIQGEGYIPKLKNCIRDLREGFARAAMNKLMKERATSNLIRSVTDNVKTTQMDDLQSLKFDNEQKKRVNDMKQVALDFLPKQSNPNGASSTQGSSPLPGLGRRESG